ncbi:MAG: reverse transcriptase domain-containing protein [Hydrogenophaga sp.]|uniref:reverse transcriptase domain-containing protein n=1 Tax=Hydrogenophaga sp. TaxID=1904254 RepID=UPI0040365E9F
MSWQPAVSSSITTRLPLPRGCTRPSRSTQQLGPPRPPASPPASLPPRRTAARSPVATPCCQRRSWAARCRGAHRAKQGRPPHGGVRPAVAPAGQPPVSYVKGALQDTDAPAPLAGSLTGVITLVPKAGKPRDQVADYRLITLLNCYVRLVARALENRLQLPLDLLGSPSQSAFILGRDISDSVQFHLSLLEYLQQRGSPAWLLLLDLAGTYDNVLWGLLPAGGGRTEVEGDGGAGGEGVAKSRGQGRGEGGAKLGGQGWEGQGAGEGEGGAGPGAGAGAVTIPPATQGAPVRHLGVPPGAASYPAMSEAAFGGAAAAMVAASLPW